MIQSIVELPVGLEPAPVEQACEPTAHAPPKLLSAIGLLTAGGDGRIKLDETTGLNHYGCQPFPDEGLRAFGSSTASVISVPAYAQAERLTDRLSRALADGAEPTELYATELGRIRGEFLGLMSLSDLDGLGVVIARSGTDLHRIMAQLVGLGAGEPPLVITCEPSETGSGVEQALGGELSAGASLRSHISQFRPAGAPHPCQIIVAPSREADGSLRPAETVDAEIAAQARAAAAFGRRVLLVLMDVSKTGLIAPSLGCALALKQRYPDQVDIMVDSCQLRLAPTTVRAYLQAGFVVATTGSKFMTGPTFSAALLIPAASMQRLGAHRLPMSLAAHTAKADWPRGWPGAEALRAESNLGLLCRWQAALDEMAPFAALPPEQVRAFFEAFAMAATARMDCDPAFQRVTQHPLDRAALNAPDSWDAVQTIHPFLLRGANGLMSPEDAHGLYRLMAMDLGGWARAVGEPPLGQANASLRVQLGQPVKCGQRSGAPVSALRLCASARLAVDALAPGGRGPQAVIDDALAALDKAAWLTRRTTSGPSPG